MTSPLSLSALVRLLVMARSARNSPLQALKRGNPALGLPRRASGGAFSPARSRIFGVRFVVVLFFVISTPIPLSQRAIQTLMKLFGGKGHGASPRRALGHSSIRSHHDSSRRSPLNASQDGLVGLFPAARKDHLQTADVGNLLPYPTPFPAVEHHGESVTLKTSVGG